MTDKKKSSVLSVCMGSACGLSSLVDYSENSVISKTILDKPAGTITVFSFDKGQGLSEHTAAYDAAVQVLDGTADIVIDGESHPVSEGEMIVMPAGVPHSLKAVERFKMILVMIRS